MTTPNEPWTDVDDYLESLFELTDEGLSAALSASAGLPAINISASYGMMLHLLAQARGARSILEIGTLGGYSTIWLARALPADGRLVTLELNPEHAEVARGNLARVGLAEQVEVRVAPALESLATLAAEGASFDFIFIDADKPGYVEYLRGVLPLAAPGAVIVADNVVRRGSVLDPAGDENARGARAFLEALAATPGLRSTVIQSVGAKGYDGFSISVVQGEREA